VLDETAKRFFMVKHAKDITIQGAPERTLELDMHPHLDLGTRTLHVDQQYYVEQEDVRDDGQYRLMDNLNFSKDKDTYTFDSLDYKQFKGVANIHYLPVKEAIQCQIMNPDLSQDQAYVEAQVQHLNIGDVFQCMRIGFFRLDSKEPLVLWFAHE
jgi:hypothetical protein